MSEKEKPGRLKEIDILYAFGVILTIIGHSHPNDWTTFPGKPIEFIYFFHMPLFFAIAGFLFARSDKLPKIGYASWIKEKTLRLLTPFFVINAVSLVPKYFLEHKTLGGITFKFILESFFAPRNSVWGHFWFLEVLFLFYCFFGAVFCLLFKTKKSTAPVSVLLLVAALCLHFVKTDILWLGLSDICAFSFYFVLGIVIQHINLAERKIKVLPSFAVGLVLTALSVTAYVYLGSGAVVSFVISLLMLAALFLFSKALSCKELKLAAFLSGNVFTFYIYSWPAQAAAEMLCTKFGFAWYVTCPIMFFVGVLFPVAIILVYGKLKFLHAAFFKRVLGVR